MPWLQLTLEVRDVPVEERLCRVGDTLWLGDHPRSVLSFPAGPVRVRACGRGVLFDGRLLAPGARTSWRHGPYTVRAEVVETSRAARLAPDLPDPRLLVASAAIILFGSWLESVHHVVTAHPDAARRVHAMLRPSLQELPAPFGWPAAATDAGASEATHRARRPHAGGDASQPGDAWVGEWPPAVRYAPTDAAPDAPR